jgi:hypothetical protein
MKLTNVQNPKKQIESVTGFLGGLNTFQDETVIKDSELTEAKNILLSVDGIQPRPGSLNYGSSVGNRVVGGIGYYKSDGTNEFIRYSLGTNKKLQKYINGVPTDIGTTIYSDVARMNFVQARDNLYIFNGVDPLSFYNGTTITTYTALTTPVGLALTTAGSAGTTTYSYRISAFNTVGETLACTSVQITTGNAVLDGTNYINVAWTATAGASGYNIFGRKATGLGETYMTTVYTNAYKDQGQDTPSLSILPPEGNSTTGVIGSMAIFAISRLFVSGNPTYPSRMYFGGTGDQIGNFSATGSVGYGGGGLDVFKNDGAKIRAILPFQGGVIIWKDNAIYKFSFNVSTGDQQLEEITRSFGGISFRSCKHVENDIIFAARKDGRLAFYSLGNQENYTASVLRTNELSIKVAEKLVDVNMAYLEHSASFYFNSIFGCAIPKSGSTVNDRIWCLDTRFGAWSYWEGIKADFFMVYTDSIGGQKLYAGSEDTGYMIEMFRDESLDNGSAVDVQWSTKSFNQKTFHKYKKYFSPILQFKDVNKSGALTGEIYLDGAILAAGFTINQQTQGGAGMGAYLFGNTLFGDVGGGTIITGLSSDIPVEVNLIKTARSIKFVFKSNSATDIKYKFLSLAITYWLLENKPLRSTNRVYAI